MRWKFRQCPADGKVQDVSLGTSDKQVPKNSGASGCGKRSMNGPGFIRQRPQGMRRNATWRTICKTSWGTCGGAGKSEKYLANLEFRVGRLTADCGWNTAKDVSADSFQAWMRGRQELKDKTANDYLEAVRCFFNWLVKLSRVGLNPLLSVEKVKTKGGKADEVRAFSDDEMLRLLAVAGARKPVYLMACIRVCGDRNWRRSSGMICTWMR